VSRVLYAKMSSAITDVRNPFFELSSSAEAKAKATDRVDTMASAADPSEALAAPESMAPTAMQSEMPTSTHPPERPMARDTSFDGQELLTAINSLSSTLAPLLACVAQQSASINGQPAEPRQAPRNDDRRSSARQQSINVGISLAQQILSSAREALAQIPATAREQTNAAVSALETITRVAVPAAVSAVTSNQTGISQQTSTSASDPSAASLWETFSRPATTASDRQAQQAQQAQTSEPRAPEPETTSSSHAVSTVTTESGLAFSAAPAIAPITDSSASSVRGAPVEQAAASVGRTAETASQNETLIQAFERMLSQRSQSQPAESTVSAAAAQPSAATASVKAESQAGSDDGEWVPLDQSSSSSSRDPQ
jgi:hypothetical protein